MNKFLIVVLFAASLGLGFWAWHDYKQEAQDRKIGDREYMVTSGGLAMASILVGILGAGLLGKEIANRRIQARKNDFESLRERLSSHGVDESDIDQLKIALETDPQPIEPGVVGDLVGAWIEAMLHKAVSGDLQIGVSEAENLLLTSIIEYYGIDAQRLR